MRQFKWIGILSACALVAGCERSSDTSASSADQSQNAPRAENQQPRTLTPTSRDTNAPNRMYAGDTNAGAMQAPDNTGKNVRDRSEASPTPEDQGGSAADRELTQRIRRAITDNNQLSTDAKNIKIITTNGKVTLRGPVKNQQELQTINSLVQQMGVTSVDNQLEVKGTNQ
jgi:hypothetical protein